jgi:hypothetical protein
MPVVVSSTLPCLGTARPGRIFAPKAPSRPAYEDDDESESRDGHLPSVEILDVVDELQPPPTVVCGYTVGARLGRGGLSVLFEVTHPDGEEPISVSVLISR